MNVKKQFGNKLKKIRKSKSITQEKLSEMSNMDRSYISDVERGVKNISLEKINKLATALEVPLSELFKFNEEDL